MTWEPLRLTLRCSRRLEASALICGGPEPRLRSLVCDAPSLPDRPPRIKGVRVSAPRESASPRERHDLARRRSRIEVARLTDLVFGVTDHLVQLRDPAH